jgi:hypothetical protein
MNAPTPEELVLKLHVFAQRATVDQLIKAMYDVTQEQFDSPNLKRQLLKTLGLQFSLKILKD